MEESFSQETVPKTRKFYFIHLFYFVLDFSGEIFAREQ